MFPRANPLAAPGPHRCAAARITRALVLDLDGTIAASKEPMDPTMATALVTALRRLSVCILSGGTFGQLRAQVLDGLAASEDLLTRLHLMPTYGTRYYARREGVWRRVYAEDLSPRQSRQIRQALEASARSLGYWRPIGWGATIEDRGSRITYSVLGRAAPVTARTAWDPDGARQRAMLAQVSRRLPDFEVRAGDSTSIDVTLKGIDKAYGIRKLLAPLAATTDDLLFIGDRLDEQGNDHPVLAMGVRCVAVQNWRDTLTVIDQFNQWWDGTIEHPTFRILSEPRREAPADQGSRATGQVCEVGGPQPGIRHGGGIHRM